jgi:hypothetical protein
LSRAGEPTGPPEDLPYRVELWPTDGSDSIERVLGRALNAQLARAIFKAAVDEHPGRRITLQRGNRILADSMGILDHK